MRRPTNIEYMAAVGLSIFAIGGCGESEADSSFDRTRQALVEYCEAFRAAPDSPEVATMRDRYADALEVYEQEHGNDVGFPPPIEGGAPIEDDGECVMPIADGPEDHVVGAEG